MKRYNVGDSVWVAAFSPYKEVRVVCPVCNGNKVVHLILGNGDKVELECEYCGKGYLSPSGVVTEHLPIARAERKTISEVRSTSDSFGTCDEYLTPGNFLYRPEDCFDSEEDALAEAEKRAAKWRSEQLNRAELVKHNQNKNYGWNAGYHMREAKRCLADAERHQQKAKVCEERRQTK